MSSKSAIPVFQEGLNDPSPIDKVVALGYHDGPTEGLLQVGDCGPVYRFQTLDEVSDPDDLDLRVYGLYPLPNDSLSKLTEVLAPYHQPHWPIWWPIWQFPSDEIRQSVDKQVQAILDKSGPLTWIVIGHLGNSPVRAMSVKLARAS